jgi:hypothetical protein
MRTTTDNQPRARQGAFKLPQWLGGALLILTLLGLGGFTLLLARPNADPGIRVWVLNHTPDQVVIINPFNGVVEKKFQVADGLKQLAFSRDFSRAYVINVVDVSNRITVLDARTFLTKETIEIDGVPQGLGVFPDNRKLVMINASKTDFMAGGFDVIDLYEQSKANPKQKKRLYRERTRELVNQLAVSDDGDRIYVSDSKSSELFIYSFKQKKLQSSFDLHGAIEELYYPQQGQYYYVSVLQHLAIYQFAKQTDKLEGVYIYEVINPQRPNLSNKLRTMAVDAKGEYLFAPIYETGAVAVWHVDDPAYRIAAANLPPVANASMYRFDVSHFLPCKRFMMQGQSNKAVKFQAGGKQVGIDSQNENLFIMDEYGGLYIYALRELGVFVESERDALQVVAPPKAKLPLMPPRLLVTAMSDDVTEIRDMQISRPAILGRNTAPAEGQP